jgi:hypothetical protein
MEGVQKLSNSNCDIPPSKRLELIPAICLADDSKTTKLRKSKSLESNNCSSSFYVFDFADVQVCHVQLLRHRPVPDFETCHLYTM